MILFQYAQKNSELDVYDSLPSHCFFYCFYFYICAITFYAT